MVMPDLAPGRWNHGRLTHSFAHAVSASNREAFGGQRPGVGLHPGDDAIIEAISPLSIGDGAIMLDSGVGACKLAAVCMMLFTTRFLVVTRREGVSEARDTGLLSRIEALLHSC